MTFFSCTGIAGVSVALFSLLTNLVGGATRSAFYYFFSALFGTLVAMVGRIILHRELSYQLMIHPITSIQISMTSVEQEGEDDEDEDITRHNHYMSTSAISMWDIVSKKSPGYICTVIYIYIITLALFPSITTQVKSVNGIESSIFISIHFLLFNMGDWIGRTLPIWKSCQVFSSHILLILSLLRTIFIPIFLSCNINLTGSDGGLIQSDFLFFSSVLAFAISNGWLTSLVFMAAPKDYPMSIKPTVGSIMTFSLVIGLALGGLSSFLVLKIFI